MNKRHLQIFAFCLSLILIQNVFAQSSGVRAQDVQPQAINLNDMGKLVLAEPARPLTPQGLDNLVAFTRLLGYVRHFYPGDEAATTDWDTFAVEGIRIAEIAKKPVDLAQKLETLFHPVAPLVRVFPGCWLKE